MHLFFFLPFCLLHFGLFGRYEWCCLLGVPLGFAGMPVTTAPGGGWVRWVDVSMVFGRPMSIWTLPSTGAAKRSRPVPWRAAGAAAGGAGPVGSFVTLLKLSLGTTPGYTVTPVAIATARVPGVTCVGWVGISMYSNTLCSPAKLLCPAG